MEFWTSGIVESETGDLYRNARNQVQKALNLMAIHNFYGDAIKEVNIIFIVNRDSINEYRRFMQKAKSLEARVRIPYEEFLASDDSSRVKMFIHAMADVIEKTPDFKDGSFHKESLINDLLKISTD